MKKDDLVEFDFGNTGTLVRGYVNAVGNDRVLVEVNGMIVSVPADQVKLVFGKRKRPKPFWSRPLFGSPAPWKRSFINVLLVLALWLSFLAFAFHFLFVSGLVLD